MQRESDAFLVRHDGNVLTSVPTPLFVSKSSFDDAVCTHPCVFVSEQETDDAAHDVIFS
jgi:hypothetical protein